jgi:hypothetical protein
MKRTIQTARYLDYPKKEWKALEELDTGVCDGMTYDEIAVSSVRKVSCLCVVLTRLPRKNTPKTIYNVIKTSSTIDTVVVK